MLTLRCIALAALLVGLQERAGAQCIVPWCSPGGVLQESQGTTLLASYLSDVHDQFIQYKIYLPEGYSNEPERYYPLLLLLPGYGSTEVYSDYFVQFVARMASGTFPKSVLVVLNPIGNAFWHDAAQSTGTAAQVQGYSTVVDELVPHLEATYRVGTLKENRALVGFSMGGYGAMNIGLRSNGFSSVTSLDGALRVPGNESPQFQFSCYNSAPQIAQHNIFTVLNQFPASAQQTFIHLLVSINGNADQAVLHNQLTTLVAPHGFEDISGTPHTWADFLAARGDSIFSNIAQHLVVPSNSVTVSVRALLQGPFVPGTGLMSAALASAGLVPLAEPYSALGYPHVGGGGEATTPLVIEGSGTNAIVDWVVLELRDALDSAVVVATRSALLRADGLVVDTDGSSAVQFTMPAGNYYVALRHRNHLGIMTSSAVSLSASSGLIDLSQVGAPVHHAAQGAVVVLGERWCLWAGDVGGDGRLSYTGTDNDRDPILLRIGGNIPTNVTTGYFQEDINLDGAVKYVGAGNDRDPILVNIGGNIPTAVRTAQLP